MHSNLQNIWLNNMLVLLWFCFFYSFITDKRASVTHSLKEKSKRENMAQKCKHAKKYLHKMSQCGTLSKVNVHCRILTHARQLEPMWNETAASECPWNNIKLQGCDYHILQWNNFHRWQRFQWPTFHRWSRCGPLPPPSSCRCLQTSVWLSPPQDVPAQCHSCCFTPVLFVGWLLNVPATG